MMVIHEKEAADTIRMAAMAYRVLKTNKLYFNYINTFNNNAITVNKLFCKERISLLMQDKKACNGNIMAILCAAIQRYCHPTHHRSTKKYNPLLFPLCHKGASDVDIRLIAVSLEYCHWIGNVLYHLTIGEEWDDFMDYVRRAEC